MFDRYEIRRGRESHYHNHSVTEKRAPTDESVRLLKEFESAARDKIEGSIQIPCTHFSCLIQWWNDASDGTIRCEARIDLNGKRIIAKHTAYRYEEKQAILMALRDAIAKEIANQGMEDFLFKTAKEFMA